MKTMIVMPLAEQKGGGELMLLDLIKHGREKGINWLVVFLSDGPMVKQIESMGIPTQVIVSGRLSQINMFATTVLQLSTIVRQEKVDLIFGWMWKAHLYSGLAAILAGIPSLWYQLENPRSSLLLKKMATFLPSKGIITLSAAGQNAQKQIWPYRPTYLVYPGVALERFHPSVVPSPLKSKEGLGLLTDRPIVGIVGRLQRWKGMHTVIEAMPQILEQYPCSHCVIVGGQHELELDYLDFLKDKVSTLKLEKHITIAGLQKNIPEWMQAMDIVVHASYNEPFGIVIIEAMALGKPVIASDSGGPTEIIEDGIHGILTPYEDHDALARAVLKYLDNPKFALQIGQAGKQRAKDFSTQKYAENIIRTIQELITQAKIN
jgi:glycosyltransferase involved in cell wall biosynthesis